VGIYHKDKLSKYGGVTMIIANSNFKERRAVFIKDYTRDNGADFSISPAVALPYWRPITRPDMTSIRGYKNFTILLTVLTADNITGIQFGILARTRKEDITFMNYELKNNLNNADFKVRLDNGLYKSYTQSFGGNSTVAMGYSWLAIMPYITSPVDSFTVHDLVIYCQA
jgi:hypothetical protein